MRSDVAPSLARSALTLLMTTAALSIAAAPAAAHGPHHSPWPVRPDVFTSRVFATGNQLTHRIPDGRETATASPPTRN